jgi:hypothetical protein
MADPAGTATSSSFSGYGNSNYYPETSGVGSAKDNFSTSGPSTASSGSSGYEKSDSSGRQKAGAGSGSSSSSSGFSSGGGMGTLTKASWSNYALIGGIIGAPLMYFYYTKNRRHGMAKETQPATRAMPIEPKIETKNLPGDSKSIKTLGGEATSSAIQNFDPSLGFNTSVSEILFPGGDMKRPIKAYRYIRYLNDDTAQSIIYDGDSKDSRLIGVEFHITEKIYNKLPAEEKRLWHSHAYEVKTGAITAPRLPEAAEREFMKQLVYTYGKAWSFWETDKGDVLPLGVPQLMVSATEAGQLPASCVSAEKMKSREDLSYPSNVGKTDPIKLRIA